MKKILTIVMLCLIPLGALLLLLAQNVPGFAEGYAAAVYPVWSRGVNFCHLSAAVFPGGIPGLSGGAGGPVFPDPVCRPYDRRERKKGKTPEKVFC